MPQSALVVTSQVSVGARAVMDALKRNGYFVSHTTLEEAAAGRRHADILVDRSLPPYDLPVVAWSGTWWNRPDRVWDAWSKSFTALAAVRSGLPHPQTVAFEPLPTEHVDLRAEYVSASSRAAAVWDLLGRGTVVVKPDRGMLGNGVTRVNTPSDLAEVMSQLRFGVVQRYIPEGSTTMRVVCSSHQVFAACDRVAETGNWLGNAAQGASLERRHVSSNDELGRLACSAVRMLRLDMAGVDIVETPSGPVVLEVNPSFGWPAALADMYPSCLDELVRALARPACSCGESGPHDASGCA